MIIVNEKHSAKLATYHLISIVCSRNNFVLKLFFPSSVQYSRFDCFLISTNPKNAVHDSSANYDQSQSQNNNLLAGNPPFGES